MISTTGDIRYKFSRENVLNNFAWWESKSGQKCFLCLWKLPLFMWSYRLILYTFYVLFLLTLWCFTCHRTGLILYKTKRTCQENKIISLKIVILFVSYACIIGELTEKYLYVWIIITVCCFCYYFSVYTTSSVDIILFDSQKHCRIFILGCK